MHGVLPASAQRAIFPATISEAEKSEPNTGVTSDAESSGWFGNLARKLWTKKAPAAVELYTGAPTSTCQRWCRGGSDITGTAMRDIIRGEEGGKFIALLLAGSKSKWARDYKRGQIALAQLDQWRQLDLGIE